MLLLLVMTAIALVGYIDANLVRRWFRQPEVTSPGTRLQSSSSPDVPDVERVSLSDSDAILVIESDQFFTPEGATALRTIVERLEALDYVDRILWMDRVPILNIFGFPQPLFPRSESSSSRFEEAKQRALRHPLVGGQLLSPDGRTLLLLIHFEWLFVQSDADVTVRLRELAEDTMREFPDVTFEFFVTGRTPFVVEMLQTQKANSFKFQLIGYSMIGLMSLVLFRGPTAVFILALAPALGVFWTLGILRFFNLQLNPFNDVVLPVLLSLVGLTDGVHLMVQIRRLRASGLSGRESARRGLSQVGLACALTSLTTAIGFGSLSLARSNIVREFGWSCVIGVVLAFLAVITVIPLACTTFLGRSVHVGHEKGLIDRNLGRISGLIDVVLRFSRPISYLAIGLTLVTTLVSLLLEPDERRAGSLPIHSEAAVGMERMDRALGGLEFSAVDVTWSEDIPSDSAEVLDVVAQVDDLLRTETLIGTPLSIRNFLETFPGDGPQAERMSMLELMPPPLKRAFYTPERRQASVSFRVQDVGIARYGPVFERIEAGLNTITAEHPHFTLELSGPAVRRWRQIYQVVMDLAASLGSAAFIIFGVLTIVYRSLRIGLISLIANVFPLAVTGTALVLTGQSLEIVSVCAFTVCLGIAVDDTIHFLTRYEEVRQDAVDEHDAIRQAFTGVGTALIMTTVVLITGFSTVLFSDMREQRIFVSMGILTIGSALVGDLIFLPALLSYFPGRSRATGMSE
ncbi:MAG: MMPL family transporter [Planctomycetaceae bacterium]|nr:MMPL family transporter [Planctomycetaceae bacterium]